MRTNILLSVAACAALAWACGADVSEPKPASAAPVAPPAPAPVPLESALEQGLTTLHSIRVADGESHRLRLLFTAAESEPMIRVDPGIVFESSGSRTTRYVSILPAEERLLPRAFRTLTVPVVALDPGGLRGREYHITAFEGGGPLGALLDAAARRAEPPDWRVLQVAAWVVVADVDLKTVRDASYLGNRLRDHVVFMGESRKIAGTVATVDEARRFLRTAGLSTEARLFSEAESTLHARLVEVDGPEASLQALYDLDFFRSRGTVEWMALRLLDQHRGADLVQGGKYVRQAAAEILGHRLLDVMDDAAERERLVAALRQARAAEVESNVLDKIDRYLAAAERAAGRSS